MARPRGNHLTPAHAEAARLGRAERMSAGVGADVRVHLDLRPLANALQLIGEDKLPRGQTISRAINRGLDKFKSAAHRELKALTKIRKPTRLKRGVHLRYSNAQHLVGRYVITDRNIRITKAYFGAKYSNFGRAGAMARWKGSASPAGASWNSWDGPRIGRTTFMIRGKAPVLIRLNHAKRLPLMPVFGPNPAQIVRLNLPRFTSLLEASAQDYLNKAIARAYRASEEKAKRRFGL